MTFGIQCLIAISFQVFDDFTRGFFVPHASMQGIQNAKDVISFEVGHGLFVEPAMQSFFLQTHRFMLFTFSWLDVAHTMNVIYLFCHIFCTLGVAGWVYFYRRPFFRLLRNSIMLTNAYALLVYENFPVAPPRALPSISVGHHSFHFLDTMYGVFSGGKIVGTQIGFNEFSAMPSIHMCWAIVVAGAIILLVRPLWIKVIAALYPAIMLIAVVVTANHFLLDAVGSVAVVMLAIPTALAYEWWRGPFSWSRPQRQNAGAV
jgi:PAP2 superfamily